MDVFQTKTYYLHTFGCQMNAKESETAAGLLRTLGYTPCDTMEQADLILFNTCCIRDLAERKAWGAIGATRALKEKKPTLLIGVFGCMMAQAGYAEQLRRRFPFVDFCFGTNSLHRLDEYLALAQQGSSGAFFAQIGDAQREFDLPLHHQSYPTAFVNIIHGCNKFCTYCIVPHVRGREKSRPLDLIVREVEQLAADGYGEVTLLGQNVNSYGKDIDSSFALLLRRLNQTGIPRIRFMTSHPRDFHPTVISAMADCKHVCAQLHLPVQSGSNEILRAMNRGYTVEQYRDTVRMLRDALPDCGITTDIIAGFPGESEAQHQQTLALLDELKFDAAFTFAFSPRKGTPAATMANQIEAEVKKRRLSEIIERQAGATKALHQSLLGTEQVVLIEQRSKRSDNQVSGKMERGRTVNLVGTPDDIGTLLPVRIVRANTNSLFGERIREEQ